ncbi:MAG: hypothetical protein NWR72_18200 [Bacteroidia bacterium]|nr:hypothetical protein [Bacteroidia bacterium]
MILPNTGAGEEQALIAFAQGEIGTTTDNRQTFAVCGNSFSGA